MHNGSAALAGDEQLHGLVRDWANLAEHNTRLSDDTITNADELENVIASLRDTVSMRRKAQSTDAGSTAQDSTERVEKLKELIQQMATQAFGGNDDSSIKDAIGGEGYGRVFAEIEAQEEIKRYLAERQNADVTGQAGDQERSVAELSDKILEKWYRQFFVSLQLPELVASIAMRSATMQAANREFCPLEVLQGASETELGRFWREAAEQLAAATRKALSGQSGDDEQVVVQGKMNDTLELGALDAFYTGLHEVIGLPKLQVLEAMEAEHASSTGFESHNQGRLIRSSPRQEWERVLPDGRDGLISTWDFDKRATLCQDFMQHRRVQDARLTKPEVIALRLYSSPMYVKYNGSLRALLTRRWRREAGAGAQDGFGEAEEEEKEVEESFVTTIHAIASALIKLSKISQHSGKKYRGLHSRAIPDCFLRPNSTGGRGGVEFGFLSTSSAKEEAVVYATSTPGGLAMPVLFEMETGMVDRGADISWVSYFPEEKEVLLPPMSVLEVHGIPRYEETEKGWVMVMPLRVNVNLKGATLEDLLHRRHVLHVAMFQNLISEVEREFVERQYAAENIAVVVAGCQEVLEVHKARRAELLNDDAEYKRALEDALRVKELALRKMKVLLRYSPAPDALARASSSASRRRSSHHRRHSHPHAVPDDVRCMRLTELASDGEYYRLLSGFEGFKWKEICEGDVCAKAVQLPLQLQPDQLAVALECLSKYSKSVQWAQYGSCELSNKTFGKLVGPAVELCGMQQRLGTDGGRLVRGILAGSSGVTALSLRDSALFSPGALQLAEGLEHVQLQTLDLQQSSLGLEGGAWVLGAGSLSSLTSLSLRFNVLSDAAGQGLLQWLRSARGVRRLDLAYCCLQEKLGLALAEEVQEKGATLEEVDLRGNALLGAANKRLAAAARAAAALQTLNGCGLPNGAARWEEPQLGRLGASDSQLMRYYVEENDQLEELNGLRPPASGEWQLGEQLGDWWASVEVPLAFVVRRLELSAGLRVVDCAEGEGVREALERVNKERALGEVRRLFKLDSQSAPGQSQLRHLLSDAARYEKPAALHALLAAGARAEEKDFHSVVAAAGEGGCKVAMAVFEAVPLSWWWNRLSERRTGVMAMAKRGQCAVLASVLRSIEDSEQRAEVVNMQDMGDQSALMMAAGRGEDFVVELLLSCGARLGQASKEGWTALHFQAKHVQHSGLETLLKHATADHIDVVDLDGFSALHFSAAAGRKANVEKLLQQRADVNLKSKAKVTPLMEAVKNGHEAVSVLLVKNGAEVDAQDSEGKTALMLATTNGHVKLAELLLAHRANHNLQDHVGRTALMFAVMKRNLQALEQLLGRLEAARPPPMRLTSALGSGSSSNPGSPVAMARPRAPEAGARRASLQRQLLAPPALGNSEVEDGAVVTIDIADEEFRTALMMAANAGLLHTVQKLVEKGADMEKKDGFGRTALMEAARNGHAQVVECLLQYGANKEHQSTSGWTALMMAAEKGHAPVVEVLIRFGAATWQKSADQRTAMDCARRKGNRIIIDLLDRKKEALAAGHPAAPVLEDQQAGLYIVPFEVPHHLVKGSFGPRDKHDLMHAKGHTVVFRLDTRVLSKLEGDWFLETLLARSVRRKWLQLLSSPLSALTLQQDRREGAGIHRDACYFSFCHPADVGPAWDWTSQESMNDTNRFLNFLSVGGFVYYNSAYEIVRINTLSVMPRPDTQAAFCFRFDTSWEMQPASIEYLDRWKRWNPVTVPFIREQGFDFFAWINPSEALGDKYISPYGGFAYRHADDHDKALYRPITLDCDLDVLPGPEDPFTTKIDNTTEGSTSGGAFSSSEAPISDPEPEEMGYSREVAPLSPEPSRFNFSWESSDDERGADSFRSSASARSAEAPHAKRTGFRGTKASRNKRRLSVEPVGRGGKGLFRGLVTGLVEVRKEVAEQLQFHLLTVADKERAKAGWREGAGKQGAGGEGEFLESDPTTWTAQLLPIIQNYDSAAKRVEKVRHLSRLLRHCPEEYRLNIAMPVSLLRVPGFGRGPLRQQVFLEDVGGLVGVDKGPVRLYVDSEGFYQCEEAVQQSLGELFPGLMADARRNAEQHWLRLQGSSLHAITLPEDVQVRAGIPADARFYAFCFPLQPHGYTPQKRASRTPSPSRNHQRGRRASFSAASPRGDAPPLLRHFSALQTASSKHLRPDLAPLSPEKKPKAARGEALVCWLQFGAFVYFDATYEVVCVNALSSAMKAKTHNLLYLGPGSRLSTQVVNQLDQGARWFPVAHPAPKKMGFTHQTWINPCEVLADRIFSMHGGFAYKGRDSNAEYFPILKSPYDGEEELSDAQPKPYKINLMADAPRESDSDAEKALAAEFVVSGKGLRAEEELQRRASLLGVEEVREAAAEEVWKAMFDEFQALHERAQALVSLPEMLDVAFVLKRSPDRPGWKPWEALEALAAGPEAQQAGLEVGEVAALRLYTTRCSRCLDQPVRMGLPAHPLPCTWSLLQSGLEKLQKQQQAEGGESEGGEEGARSAQWSMAEELTPEALSKGVLLKTPLSAFRELPPWMLAHCCPPLSEEEEEEEALVRKASVRTDTSNDSASLRFERRRSGSSESFVSSVSAEPLPEGPCLLRIRPAREESAAPIDVSWLSVYPLQHVLYPSGTLVHVAFCQGVRGRRGQVATVLATQHASLHTPSSLLSSSSPASEPRRHSTSSASPTGRQARPGPLTLSRPAPLSIPSPPTPQQLRPPPSASPSDEETR